MIKTYSKECIDYNNIFISFLNKKYKDNNIN